MSQKQAKVSLYKAQGSYAMNRQRRLERHLKAHPEDVKAIDALKANVINPKRKTPNSKLGWLSNAVGSQIISRFNGQPTKQAAFAFARAFRFMKVRPFMMSPVLVGGPDNTVLLKMKHTSKLSNFKGAVKTAA